MNGHEDHGAILADILFFHFEAGLLAGGHVLEQVPIFRTIIGVCDIKEGEFVEFFQGVSRNSLVSWICLCEVATVINRANTKWRMIDG